MSRTTDQGGGAPQIVANVRVQRVVILTGKPHHPTLPTGARGPRRRVLKGAGELRDSAELVPSDKGWTTTCRGQAHNRPGLPSR